MQIVIKGTKTIDEYKKVYASMQERANRYSQQHIASCDHWQNGLPVKCWRDNNSFDVLWIEYESGNAWQYKETFTGLKWW